MFRKMAIALVAASVFAAPVLAQGTLGGAASPSKSPQSTPAPAAPSGEAADKAVNPEKAEKSAATTEKATKTVTRHHRVVSHHRRGTKTAKYVKSHKTTIYGKHPGTKSAKYTKVESRRIGHGKTMGKPTLGAEMAKSTKAPRHNISRGYNRTTSMHAYGKASKGIPSKSMTKPSTKPSVD